jgi:uncharacterized membrane protein
VTGLSFACLKRLISLSESGWPKVEGKLPLLFLTASLLVGILSIAVNPPLRGPDESVHFTRAYAIAHGEFVPKHGNASRERGIFLSPPLGPQFRYFEEMRESVGARGYDEVFRRYFEHVAMFSERLPTFSAYGGSEAYTPMAYLPYAAAAIVAQAAGLDFLGHLYLMRIAGLVVAVVITAYAIALTPRLKWVFFCTAMLPTALYQRGVINVDGALLAATLLVIALCLRSIGAPGSRIWQRSFWMTVTSLTKPSQVVFVLLEAMRLPYKHWKPYWPISVVVMAPGTILALAWTFIATPDVEAWHVAEADTSPPHEFDPLWKMQYLLQHPLNFLRVAFTTLDYSGELCQQAIGVFGWLDVKMRSWTYPLLSVLLALTFFDKLDLNRRSRLRVGLVAATTMLAYYLLVCVLFFVTFTPTDADRIYGVQGRYLIVLIPLCALFTSAIVNRRLSPIGEMAALTSAVVSAAAMLEAVWRVHWSS